MGPIPRDCTMYNRVKRKKEVKENHERVLPPRVENFQEGKNNGLVLILLRSLIK